MSQYEEILIGRSIPLDEVDDGESNLDDLIPIAEIEADFADIISHLGTEDFKFIFLNLYDEIMNLPFEKKRELCQKLTDKIFEVYNFEFSPLLTFDEEKDIDEFFKFIEFLEYDYLDIITEIISGLDIDLLKKDTNKFLRQNIYKIYNNINKLIINKKINVLISIFLRTNNKEELLSFLESRMNRDKMLIILTSLQGEFLI
jgi:hypothetical protein